MEATVSLLDGMRFEAHTGTGHDVLMDVAAESGGADSAARPMEMLLIGLGGCTGMDVISMLRKMRQDVTGYFVQVHGDRADDHPKVFVTIRVEHVVRGHNVNVELVRRAVELSARRYCPAAAMLGKSARIEESFRVLDEDTGTEQTGAVAVTA